MKKLILIVFSAIVLGVFIALNYLLWDREMRINKNADSVESINALSRQIKSQTDENRQLNIKIYELEDSVKALQGKLSQADSENKALKETLQTRENTIAVMKGSADLAPLVSAIGKWVEAIDGGQYDVAYNLMAKSPTRPEKNEFTTNYKASVKSMSIASVTYAGEAVQNDRKGEIVIRTVLKVVRSTPEGKVALTDGSNVRLFAMIYDKDKTGWVINDIFTEKQ